MNESTVLRDGEGNYYTFPPDVLAAAQTAEGTYELAEEAVVAARVPDDGVEAVESALGIQEVSGFGYTNEPIPGVDIIVRKKPGGTMAPFMDMGTHAVRYGASRGRSLGQLRSSR
jgi:hypothetical protein